MEGFLGERCYKELVVNQNLFDSGCNALVISKLLGVAILAGALVVKLPQIVKIVGAKSAKGISLTSMLLEMLMFLISWSYSFRSGFAFNTYGESAFMSMQDVVIVFLIFLYGGGLSLQFFLIISAYFATVYVFLFNPSDIFPMTALTALQAFSIPILILSRVPQIISNFRAKSTGQLAFVTWFMNFVGSAARVFTTTQETKDPTLLAGYIISVLLNGIIVFQILFYGDAESKASNNNNKPKQSRPKKDN